MAGDTGENRREAGAVGGRRFAGGGATFDQRQVPENLRACIPTSEELDRFFQQHARSFAFAARWYSEAEYRAVVHVYAFCRTTDDLVDETAGPPAEVGRRLDQWHALARDAYEGRPSGVSWLDDLMERSVRAGVPLRLIDDLMAGVRTDVGTVRLDSMDDLHLYAYRVASVVGMWLCYLFDAGESSVLRRAAAMGRAMQLTNIVRDVGEDLRRQRVYLPAELMEGHGVTYEALQGMASGAEAISPAYRALVEDLMKRADAEYEYAFSGLAALPVSFARASAVAAEVYRGIHRAVRRNGYDNFRRRAYTSGPEKALLGARALYRLWRVRRRSDDPAVVDLSRSKEEHGGVRPAPDFVNVSPTG